MFEVWLDLGEGWWPLETFQSQEAAAAKAMLLQANGIPCRVHPPKEEYVNMYPNCFHPHELATSDGETARLKEA